MMDNSEIKALRQAIEETNNQVEKETNKLKREALKGERKRLLNRLNKSKNG